MPQLQHSKEFACGLEALNPIVVDGDLECFVQKTARRQQPLAGRSISGCRRLSEGSPLESNVQRLFFTFSKVLNSKILWHHFGDFSGTIYEVSCTI